MAKLKRPSLTKPTAKPTLGKPAIKPMAKPVLGKPSKLSKPVAALAAKVTTKEVIEVAGEEIIFDEAANTYATVDEKIKNIEAMLAAEDLPVARLKSGLKDVMTCLKDNEDDIMALEPSDISTIVKGYMQLASEEERRIVEGAKPKTGKKKAVRKSALLKKYEKLAAEIDIDEVEF